MTDYGLKVSKKGKNVELFDPLYFYFLSDWETVKILKEGTATITVPINDQTEKTTDINHGLLFRPLVIVYAEANAKGFLVPSFVPENDWEINCWFSISKERLRISVKSSKNQAATKSFFFRYYILANKFI